MHSLAHIECVVVGNKRHSSSSRTMALRTTLAQLQAQPQGAPSALMRGLTRWKQSARARAADISTRPGEAPVADVARKTFRHWRNEETGHWQPPKYSQRRQAQLVRAAYKMGTEDSVVSSPKFARYARRMENMPTHEVLVGWPTVTWPTLSAEKMQTRHVALHGHMKHMGRMRVVRPHACLKAKRASENHINGDSVYKRLCALWMIPSPNGARYVNGTE